MRPLVVGICVALLLICTYVSLPVFAEPLPVDLLDFLKPLDAKVVMSVNSEILIDKGSSDGFYPGDILSAVTAEKIVRHPDTGQALDTLFTYGNHLIVTRVKENISYCSVLNRNENFENGVRLRRFANVPVEVLDTTSSGFKFYKTLRQKTPHLKWLGYRVEPKKDVKRIALGLLVQLGDNKVKVLNQDDKILYSEELKNVVDQADVNESYGVAPDNAISEADPLKSEVFSNSKMSDKLNNSMLRINLPTQGEIGALRVSDLDNDGQAEILYSVDNNIIISRLDGQHLVEVSRYSNPAWDQVVDISVIDINDDSKDEIIVSAIGDNHGTSSVFSYEDRHFTRLVEERIMLGTFLPINNKPILVGVEDGDYLYPRPDLYKVKLSGKEFVKVPFEFGSAKQPYGIASFRDTQGNVLRVVLSRQNKIKTFELDGEQRWESSLRYGGTTNSIKVPIPGARNVDAFDKFYFSSKMLRTPSQTLIVAKHDKPGVLKNSPTYSNGQIVELSWNGYSLDEIYKSDSVGGMITDFDYYDIDGDGDFEIVASVLYQKNGYNQKPYSGLVVLN